MKITRCAAAFANPISWDTTSMVIPSPARASMTSRTSLIISGSQRGGRLVEEHDVGVHREGAGDRHPLLLPAGKLGGVALRLVLETDPPEEASGFLVGLPFLGPLHHEGREGDVVERVEVRKEVEGLEDHPHLFPHFPDVRFRIGHADLVDPDAARAQRFSRRFMHLMRVDFPLPEGPMMSTTSPL